MIAEHRKGKGPTGAIRYVMGQGRDRQTGRLKQVAPGQPGRASFVGAQGFGYQPKDDVEIDTCRKVMEHNGSFAMQASQNGKKCVKDAAHFIISWPPGYRASPQEKVEAWQSYLKAVGMEKAQALAFSHNDTDKDHLHIVASRIDRKTGYTIPDKDLFNASMAWTVRWEKSATRYRRARSGSTRPRIWQPPGITAYSWHI